VGRGLGVTLGAGVVDGVGVGVSVAVGLGVGVGMSSAFSVVSPDDVAHMQGGYRRRAFSLHLFHSKSLTGPIRSQRQRLIPHFRFEK